MWITKNILLLISICLVMVNLPLAKTQSITNGMAQFAGRLHASIAENGKSNIISPFAVFKMLGLLSLGASGNTFKQLSTTLGTGNKKQRIATEFKNYIDLLNEAGDFSKFLLVNRLYVNATKENGCALNQQYNKLAVNKFMTDIETVNFEADPTEIQNEINSFVNQNTNGAIPKLLNEPLGSDSSLVVVNGIYFKGNWLHSFDEARTYRGHFTGSFATQSVDFMNTVTNRFKYGKIGDLDATALQLPYDQSNLAFFILLPNRKNLVDLTKKLEEYTDSDYLRIAQQMHKQNVNVTIPKFTIESSYELSKVLNNLGLDDIFTESANLSGILTCNKSIKLSKVIQKVQIKIDEKGKPTAATGLDITTPKEFIANHAFIYWVWDTKKHGILMMGQFS